jgi:hypothetical protein
MTFAKANNNLPFITCPLCHECKTTTYLYCAKFDNQIKSTERWCYPEIFQLHDAHMMELANREYVVQTCPGGYGCLPPPISFEVSYARSPVDYFDVQVESNKDVHMDYALSPVIKTVQLAFEISFILSLDRVLKDIKYPLNDVFRFPERFLGHCRMKSGFKPPRPASRQMINTLLLMGCVEPHPGPRGRAPIVNRRGRRPPVRAPLYKTVRYKPSSNDGLTFTLVTADIALTANGSGLFPVTTILSSVVNTIGYQWADLQPRWLNYRIDWMEFHYCPRWPVNSGMAINLGHTRIYCGDFGGNNPPTTVLSIKADRHMKEYLSNRSFVYKVNWKRNDNAKLWTPTNATIPVLSAFGIAICTSDLVNQLPVSIPFGQYYLKIGAQFKDAA